MTTNPWRGKRTPMFAGMQPSRAAGRGRAPWALLDVRGNAAMLEDEASWRPCLTNADSLEPTGARPRNGPPAAAMG